MSGGGGQTSTTSNAPPPEFTQAYKAVNAQAGNVASVPYQPYPGQVVAGLSPDQMRGISDVESSSGIAAPYINSAAQHIDQATAPIWGGVQQFSPGAVSQYENPYTTDVINATQRQFNNQNQIQQQGIVGNAISQGAFGGDRSAVAQGITAGQQQLAQAPVLAGLRNQNYQQALQEFNQQQGAQIGANEANAWLHSQAGSAMAGLGQEALGTSLTGANALLGIGGLEQTQAQAGLNVPYQQWLAAQAYPYQSTGWLANIAEGLGGASGGTSSSTAPSPSVASQIGGGALAGVGVLGQTGAFGSNGYLTGSGGVFGSGGGGSSAGIDAGSWDYAASGGRISHRDAGGGIGGFPAPGVTMPTGVPDVNVSVVPGATGMGSAPASHGTMDILKNYGSTSHTTGNGDTTIGNLLKAAGTIAAGVYGGPAGGLAASALSSQVHFDRGGGIVPFPMHRVRAGGGGITANDNWGSEPVRHFAAGGYNVSTTPSAHSGPAVPMLSYTPDASGITGAAPQAFSGGIAPSSVQDYLSGQQSGAHYAAPQGYVPPPPPPAPTFSMADLLAAQEEAKNLRLTNESASSGGGSEGGEAGNGMAAGGIVALDEGGDVPAPINVSPDWNDPTAFAARNDGLPIAPEMKGMGPVTGNVPYKLAPVGITTEPTASPREKPRGIVSDAADIWHQPYAPGVVNVSSLIRPGESGGGGDTNVKNPRSSAQGPDQFTTGTWNQFLASDAGRGYTQADRNNANANTVATNWLAEQNAARIKSVTGVQPTVGQVAAAHMLGGEGAANLLSHPNDPIKNYLDPAAISGNSRILRPDMTGAEAVNAVEQYYASGATSGGGSEGTSAGIFTGATTSHPVSAGIMPPDVGSDVVEPPAYSPWRTLTNVGLGILGGNSPNAGTNIGRGALQGVEISDKEKQSEATQALARQQASASNMFRKAQLTLEGARADQTERHQTRAEDLQERGLTQNENYRRDALAQRGQERADALDARREAAAQSHYSYQPVTQEDPDNPGKKISGVMKFDSKGTEPPTFIRTDTDPNKTGGGGGSMGSREGAQFQRVVNAGNAATAALTNIAELPSETDSGLFGPRQPGHSLMGAFKESLANTVTSQNVQSFNSMVAGVSRNLATLETFGLAPSGSFVGSMDATILKSGDTEETKLRKMAEMRQIIETNLEPALHNPRVPAEQKDYIKSIIGQVQQVVPYTHHDITQLSKSTIPGQTLADVAKNKGLGAKQEKDAPTKTSLPPRDQLKTGTIYDTARGKAKWDGSQFIPVNP